MQKKWWQRHYWLAGHSRTAAIPLFRCALKNRKIQCMPLQKKKKKNIGRGNGWRDCYKGCGIPWKSGIQGAIPSFYLLYGVAWCGVCCFFVWAAVVTHKDSKWKKIQFPVLFFSFK
jgi:hypothetical protein